MPYASPATPRDLPVWQHAAASLQAGVPVALLCVLASEGSSPGRQGFKMSVTADSSAGSIGGGVMEHKFVELARTRLPERSPRPLLRQQIHRKDSPADRSGMICSGEQWVLLFPLSLSDLPAVLACTEALTQNTSGLLVFSAEGGLQVQDVPSSAPRFGFQAGEQWQYQERLGFASRATIIGAGHVSLALCRVLAALDFELTVLDDRPDLPTLLANPFPHHKRTVAYENITAEIPEGPDEYVLIMTVGYRSDLVVLRQLLGHSVRYLGVLGSQAKIAELLSTLRAEGVSEESLARISAPIGLPIHSRTPEEIAISIAAELIQVRNR
ncbi:xanthine dehydrogenase accessory factor [Hymenobacter gelipurpurascens]|uniref:Xanthine dehydrogenase accessory factor n=1 Tax=Hymenobacter gelipurpurascens TaxID=89968 RepID=A0A212TPC5_9BACT|nr:XdhC/CoxI family protein [Hymenobacter gelipurpurascens]SNC67879.1 xanthine dehydrogenase accessory factor [Hymenobacter gelipurpurascens]